VKSEAPLRARLASGLFIPAHPLALTNDGSLDERCQRALTRYYLDAGASGIAAGVHTTQFQIHAPGTGLYEPVLRLCAETVDEYCSRSGKEILKVGGVIGETGQALREAEICHAQGYDAVLLSLAAFRQADNDVILEHCRIVAELMPVFGFYLQPAVGGRILDYAFWREFADIPNVVAIKIAPFNRYHTLDVVRAVIDSGNSGDISLYTGNDDHIVLDLLTPYRFNDEVHRIVGGLLGHWSFRTRAAVRLFEAAKACAGGEQDRLPELLRLAEQVTDLNAAVFDAAHGFAGCIPGIQDVLYRDGLIRSVRCLDGDARLSPGQREEIDRVTEAYPHLRDDEFIAERLDSWMS
jgi:hypothetical protein